MTSDHSLLGDPVPKIERRNFFQSTNIYGYGGKIWVDAHVVTPKSVSPLIAPQQTI